MRMIMINTTEQIKPIIEEIEIKKININSIKNLGKEFLKKNNVYEVVIEIPEEERKMRVYKCGITYIIDTQFYK